MGGTDYHHSSLKSYWTLQSSVKAYRLNWVVWLLEPEHQIGVNVGILPFVSVGTFQSGVADAAGRTDSDQLTLDPFQES
jgi:hypothetical protein